MPTLFLRVFGTSSAFVKQRSLVLFNCSLDTLGQPLPSQATNKRTYLISRNDLRFLTEIYLRRETLWKRGTYLRFEPRG
jgi:hypothetical protein